MTVARLSLTVSPELNEILRATAANMGVDLSRAIETLLRENPVIQAAVARRRGAVATKRGRDPQELLLLGRVAAKQWDAALKAGSITFPRKGDAR